MVNLIVELEIPQLRGVDISYTTKIKQLLYIIAESAPFIPNVSKLSERIGISRNSLLAYLDASMTAVWLWISKKKAPA